MIKTIFWDFDGVILDSMPIRDFGFAKTFIALCPITSERFCSPFLNSQFLKET